MADRENVIAIFTRINTLATQIDDVCNELKTLPDKADHRNIRSDIIAIASQLRLRCRDITQDLLNLLATQIDLRDQLKLQVEKGREQFDALKKANEHFQKVEELLERQHSHSTFATSVDLIRKFPSSAFVQTTREFIPPISLQPIRIFGLEHHVTRLHNQVTSGSFVHELTDPDLKKQAVLAINIAVQPIYARFGVQLPGHQLSEWYCTPEYFEQLNEHASTHKRHDAWIERAKDGNRIAFEALYILLEYVTHDIRGKLPKEQQASVPLLVPGACFLSSKYGAVFARSALRKNTTHTEVWFYNPDAQEGGSSGETGLPTFVTGYEWLGIAPHNARRAVATATETLLEEIVDCIRSKAQTRASSTTSYRPEEIRNAVDEMYRVLDTPTRSLNDTSPMSSASHPDQPQPKRRRRGLRDLLSKGYTGRTGRSTSPSTSDPESPRPADEDAPPMPNLNTLKEKASLSSNISGSIAKAKRASRNIMFGGGQERDHEQDPTITEDMESQRGATAVRSIRSLKSTLFHGDKESKAPSKTHEHVEHRHAQGAGLGNLETDEVGALVIPLRSTVPQPGNPTTSAAAPSAFTPSGTIGVNDAPIPNAHPSGETCTVDPDVLGQGVPIWIGPANGPLQNAPCFTPQVQEALTKVVPVRGAKRKTYDPALNRRQCAEANSDGLTRCIETQSKKHKSSGWEDQNGRCNDCKMKNRQCVILLSEEWAYWKGGS